MIQFLLKIKIGLFVLIVLLSVFSCKHSTPDKEKKVIRDTLNIKKNEPDTEEKVVNEFREVSSLYMDTLWSSNCPLEPVEFIDFYSIVDSIADDKYEKLKLVDSLKTRGYKVVNWGRGNWMNGPRIISITLTYNDCECRVEKLYYSTEDEGLYKVTERISCKPID